jgi:methionyl-tRNA synthetase
MRDMYIAPDVGVFGNDIMDTNIPVDVWRYYLLSNRPETDDTDFKWSDLQARNNGELLANLGNFVNRVLQFTASKAKCVLQEIARKHLRSMTMPCIAQSMQTSFMWSCASRFGGVVPDGSHLSAAEGLGQLGAKLDSLVQAYLTAMEKIRLREGIRIAFEVTRAGNGFITVLP